MLSSLVYKYTWPPQAATKNNAKENKIKTSFQTEKGKTAPLRRDFFSFRNRQHSNSNTRYLCNQNNAPLVTHILHTALASPVRLHSLEMRGKKIFDFARRAFLRACDLVKVRSVCFELPLLTDYLNKLNLKKQREIDPEKQKKKVHYSDTVCHTQSGRFAHNRISSRRTRHIEYRQPIMTSDAGSVVSFAQNEDTFFFFKYCSKVGTALKQVQDYERA